MARGFMGEEWGTADQPGECAQLLAIQVVLLGIFFLPPLPAPALTHLPNASSAAKGGRECLGRPRSSPAQPQSVH